MRQKRVSRGCRSGSLQKMGGLWAGKLLLAATRLGGRGGTTLPGRTAELIAPGLLPDLAGQLKQGSLAITGTNGKTTTACLLAGIFRQAGFSVLHNRTGSNLTWGVASAFIQAASWRGRLTRDIGIIESDEGVFPGVLKALSPRGVVITNIFRDQLDRYGEVDRIRAILRQGLASLPDGSLVVLNADDPSLAGLEQGSRLRTVYYGLSVNLPAAGHLNTGRDLKSCPLCGRMLTYSIIYYAHLGRYRCPACSFRRPEPQVKLTGRTLKETGKAAAAMIMPGAKIKFDFSLPGVYNLYNALAAAAGAYACGLPAGEIAAGLTEAVPSFGRMEQFQIGERRVIMALIKNPVGANEILRTFLEHPGRLHLLIAINDNYADGTDISWLWDVDFEQLAPVQERLTPVMVSGIRAADMGVRLKYAGLEPPLINLEPDLKTALVRFLNCPSGPDPLYILPTYTAMLALRREINRLGIARPFWEEP